MKCVILFDIDGTLLVRRNMQISPGIIAMNEAAYKMTGVLKLAQSIDFAGATDLGVAEVLLKKGGITDITHEKKIELLIYYLEALKKHINKESYIPIGNLKEVIPRLKKAGAIIGLGTGNIKDGALVKLEYVDFLHLFNPELGGYGEDGQNRIQIIKAAILRCDKTGKLPVIVVGDTPKDVFAAHENKAFCIGVTNSFKEEAKQVLLKAGADAVVEKIDLSLICVIEKLLKKN